MSRFDFDEAYNQKHDPQRQTPAGFCRNCGGEIFEFDTLESYDGLCPACWWAENGGSGTGDPSPTEMLEEYDGENSGCHGRAANDRPYGGTDSSAPLRSDQNDEGGRQGAVPTENGGEGD